MSNELPRHIDTAASQAMGSSKVKEDHPTFAQIAPSSLGLILLTHKGKGSGKAEVKEDSLEF